MTGLRIMIVEDDVMLASILGELLEALGHAVCATESTQTGAAAAAARLRPDLILVDVTLAEGDGAAAMAAVERSRKAPHVYMSGRALNAGDLAPGAVILRKPFSERLLAQAIDRALAPPPV